MARQKRSKCVKCQTAVYVHCKWCDDPICYFHSYIDTDGKRQCGPCSAKYYMIWQKEKDEEHQTELAYLDWCKEKANDDKMREIES